MNQLSQHHPLALPKPIPRLSPKPWNRHNKLGRHHASAPNLLPESKRHIYAEHRVLDVVLLLQGEKGDVPLNMMVPHHQIPHFLQKPQRQSVVILQGYTMVVRSKLGVPRGLDQWNILGVLAILMNLMKDLL